MLVENLAQGLTGVKDTQVQIALAQALYIKWVQNRGNLLRANSQVQIPSSDLSVPKKLFYNLQAVTEHGPKLALVTLKCTSSTLPLV